VLNTIGFRLQVFALFDYQPMIPLNPAGVRGSMNYLNLFKLGKVRSVPQSAAMLGTMGAVVGGTVSAIGNTYKVAKGEQRSADALANVAKETVGSGISTAAAAATITALGIGGLIGFASFAAVASISKGLLDSILYGDKKQTAANA
jgi:hypothetical protein